MSSSLGSIGTMLLPDSIERNFPLTVSVIYDGRSMRNN
jgi:hypothetical protein